MTSERESRLVAQARLGNGPALERLLERRYPEMLRLAQGILRDEDDAEDATQEAAMKVYQNLHQLEKSVAFAKWSNMILRRCCFRLLQQRQLNRERYAALEDCMELECPANSGARIEDGIRVGEIFHQLGEQTSEILQLRLALGLSVRETAATLGVTETAIKVRLHRARQKALSFA